MMLRKAREVSTTNTLPQKKIQFRRSTGRCLFRYPIVMFVLDVTYMYVVTTEFDKSMHVTISKENHKASLEIIQTKKVLEVTQISLSLS